MRLRLIMVKRGNSLKQYIAIAIGASCDKSFISNPRIGLLELVCDSGGNSDGGCVFKEGLWEDVVNTGGGPSIPTIKIE
jgi:hypothetical protein